jgi:hypothetical protein
MTNLSGKFSQGRDKDRIKKILAEIESVWEKHPDTRFYQLIAWFETDYPKIDKFYLEDEHLQQGISNWKKIRGVK